MNKNKNYTTIFKLCVRFISIQFMAIIFKYMYINSLKIIITKNTLKEENKKNPLLYT